MQYECEVIWDTDGEDVDLPKNVTVSQCELPDFEDVSEALVEYLTSAYGFCVDTLVYTERAN